MACYADILVLGRYVAETHDPSPRSISWQQVFYFFIFYYQIETENARIVSEQVDVEKLNLKRDSKCVYKCLSEL